MRFEAETIHTVESTRDKEEFDVQIRVKNSKLISELE